MQVLYFYTSLSSFVLGVGIATVFPLLLPEIAFLFLVAAGLAVVRRGRSEASAAPYLLSATLAVFFLAAGFFRVEVALRAFDVSPLEGSLGATLELQGIVVREPDVRETSVHLYVESDEDLLLVTADPFTEVRYGDQVTVRGTLERPATFITDLGREFDYPNYLKAKGVEYRISFASVEVLSSNNANPFLAFLYDSKQSFTTAIESVIGEPQSGLGQGLLLGVKRALGDELEEAFRVSGIIHVVVLSGYNIMLVVAFVMFVSSFFLRERARTIFGICAIVGFALLVGLSATVVRASIMASLLLIAQALGRTYNITRALFFAGAVMVGINPYILLYDIGFQLSFMATIGLVFIAPRFEAMVAQGVSLNLKEYVIATIATQIAVLPLLMYHIGQVSLIAVLANLLILPVVPFAMLATFAAGLSALISPVLALPFAYLAHLILSYIIAVATWCASIPYAAVLVPTFSASYVFVLYALMTGVFWWSVKREQMSASSEVDDWQIEEEIEKVGGSHSDPPTKDSSTALFR